MKLDQKQMSDLARQIRRDVIRMVNGAGAGHPGGALGAAEVLAVLYGSDMTQSADSPADPNRDRFVLSNGHICAAWYSVLARVGYIKPAELGTLRKLGTRLQGHPSREKWSEMVESSSGPLGQGPSFANGLAMANKLSGSTGRVYCFVGDGELHEGIVWEAALTAGHRKISNLTLIVSHNNVQIDGLVRDVKNVQPLDAKFEAFGWLPIAVDGHDISAVSAAFAAGRAEKNRPTVVIANTVLGSGVSYMENLPKWHGTCPSDEEVQVALDEIGTASGYTDYPSTPEATS